MSEHEHKRTSTITVRVPQKLFDELRYLVKPQFGSTYELLQQSMASASHGDLHAARMGNDLQELYQAKARVHANVKDDNWSKRDPLAQENATELLTQYQFNDATLVSYVDVIGGRSRFEQWCQAQSLYFDAQTQRTQARILKIYQMIYGWYLKSKKIKILSFKIPRTLKQAAFETITAKGWRVSDYLRNCIRYYVYEAKQHPLSQTLVKPVEQPQPQLVSLKRDEYDTLIKGIQRLEANQKYLKRKIDHLAHR